MASHNWVLSISSISNAINVDPIRIKHSKMGDACAFVQHAFRHVFYVDSHVRQDSLICAQSGHSPSMQRWLNNNNNKNTIIQQANNKDYISIAMQ